MAEIQNGTFPAVCKAELEDLVPILSCFCGYCALCKRLDLISFSGAKRVVPERFDTND